MSLRTVLLVAAVLGTAGCGSTVAFPQGAGTQGLDVVASGASSATGLPSAESAGPVGPGAAQGPTGGAAPGTPGIALPAPGTGSTPTLGALRGDGPGVTATTITVGITYYQSAKAANEAVGASGIDTGDPVAATRVLIKAVNDAGGVAGRRLVPVLFAVDPQSTTPYATEAQAECTFFTQDHKVLVVVDGAPAADARACLAQHGVAVLGGPIVTAHLTPNEVDPYGARLDRAFGALVPSLVQQGWFGGWNRLTGGAGSTRARVGVVTVDNPYDNRVVDGVLLPALRRAGYPPNPADVIRIAPPGGFGDDGATAVAIDNAALKLSSDGVDHVILTDGNGSLSLLFNNYAYSQHYFPRYGGTSGNAWQVLLAAGDIQASTLAGAMGIGWQPLFDLPYQAGAGPYGNAARTRCFGIFKKAGLAATDAASAGGQAEGCDVVFLLQAALGSYRGPVDLSVVLQHVEALGTSYPLASGLGSRFAPDQRDGAGGYAPMRFDSSCRCMAYAGARQPMPR